MNALTTFFSVEMFMPHGTCFLWRADLILLHSVADGVIALSYYSIPLALVYFSLRRRDLKFRTILLLFGIFILACGTTHILEIVTLWVPVYGIEGIVKVLTAVASFATAIVLWQIMPAALAIPSPTQLERTNRSLQVEVAERHEAERRLRSLTTDLERRVAERTAELERLNADLTQEIAVRRQIDERFRRAIEGAPNGIVMVDTAGTIALVNEQTEALFGYRRDEMLGQPVEILVPDQQRSDHPDLRTNYFGAPEARPMGVGRDLSARRKDGSSFPVEIGLNPIDTPDGVQTLATIVDITERKRAEAHRDILIRELNHRVKNNMAVIAAIADITARGADSVAGFTEAFRGRIQAMAAAHTLLAASDWTRAEIGDLVGATLQPFGTADSGNFTFTGDSAYLNPEEASALALVLHELATNAFKYGALSVPEGRVAVRWSMNPGAAGSRLRLEWTESGGPAVAPPTRRGFGTPMIERIVTAQLGGTVAFDYAVPGLTCRIAMPVSVT